MPSGPDDASSPDEHEQGTDVHRRREATRGRDLTSEDFIGRATTIARDLVGRLLLNHAPGASDGEPDSGTGPVGGRIVETEAYVNAVDPACHLASGRTPRTESFFHGPSTVYVYVMHGHHALNLISTYRDHPEGILIRAIEPTHGLDIMQERRGFDDPHLLASGPGRLTEAIGVTKDGFDGQQLGETTLTISETAWNPDVETTARIGVTAARDWPLRYVAAESAFLSKPAPVMDLNDEAVGMAYRALETRNDLPTVD